LTVVVDATVAVTASTQVDGFELLGDELAAPPLLWPEVRSVLHRSLTRAGVLSAVAAASRARFEQAPIEQLDPPGLSPAVWEVADALGWAKTYDAEYLALARLLAAPILTLDARMRRAANRLQIEVATL
jgi:predicted nucleic acid-binding protein